MSHWCQTLDVASRAYLGTHASALKWRIRELVDKTREFTELPTKHGSGEVCVSELNGGIQNQPFSDMPMTAAETSFLPQSCAYHLMSSYCDAVLFNPHGKISPQPDYNENGYLVFRWPNVSGMHIIWSVNKTNLDVYDVFLTKTQYGRRVCSTPHFFLDLHKMLCSIFQCFASCNVFFKVSSFHMGFTGSILVRSWTIYDCLTLRQIDLAPATHISHMPNRIPVSMSKLRTFMSSPSTTYKHSLQSDELLPSLTTRSTSSRQGTWSGIHVQYRVKHVGHDTRIDQQIQSSWPRKMNDSWWQQCLSCWRRGTLYWHRSLVYNENIIYYVYVKSPHLLCVK